jgi:hypothetical protein
MESKESKYKKRKSKKNEYDKIDVQSSNNIVINIKNISSSNCSDVLPGYEYENAESNIKQSSSKCWNCCHSFNVSHSIPIKYTDNIFYIYGTFCSDECGCKFIFDNFDDRKVWEYYSLLNLYHNIRNGSQGVKINPAPSRYMLDEFGGSLTIDEYRDSFKKANYNINICPIIPINHENQQIDIKINKGQNKQNYKLYRKSPINKLNNIYNTMNLHTDITE